MPQFDFLTYSSQIFWFGISFAVLYFFMSKIILPRINDIENTRKNVIESDLSLAKELDNKISAIEVKTENLRKEAGSKYQLKLDEATKKAAKEREKSIEDLKEKLDQSAKKSHQELRNFVEKSKANSASVVQNLTKTIKGKIFKNV